MGWDGRVSFSEFHANRVVWLDGETGALVAYEQASPGAQTRKLTVDLGNRVWYADYGNSKIAVILETTSERPR